MDVDVNIVNTERKRMRERALNTAYEKRVHVYACVSVQLNIYVHTCEEVAVISRLSANPGECCHFKRDRTGERRWFISKPHGGFERNIPRISGISSNNIVDRAVLMQNSNRCKY